MAFPFLPLMRRSFVLGPPTITRHHPREQYSWQQRSAEAGE